jgi:hypothetical protein
MPDVADTGGVSRPPSSSLRPVDKLLVGALCVFAFTSIFIERYIALGVDLPHATDRWVVSGTSTRRPGIRCSSTTRSTCG